MKKLIPAFICLLLAVPCQARIIFVDANTPDNNDGLSWAKAYQYLQDALADTNSSGDVNEIRIAQGIYTPDSTSANPNGTGDRYAAFQLINAVTIKGGYFGYGPDPNARDTELYETILSGDLSGNDGPGFTNNDENCYHVVTGSGTDATAVLDGFTITAGNADRGGPPHCFGGGMYNESASPTVTNCTLSGNYSHNGGGMYNISSSTAIINCIFVGNSARCGGAVLNDESNLLLVNCLFSGNSASTAGGAIYDSHSNTTLVNCTFSQNSGNTWGGGVHGAFSETTLINCILWANTAESGSQIAMKHSSIVSVSYSDVQGGQAAIYLDNSSIDWGEGNIDADPLFVNAEGADNVLGTNDDNLRLLAGSPCLDAGDNAAVPPSVLTDLDGNPRFTDDPATPDTGSGTPPIVDMGAYEGPNSGFLLSTESVTIPEGATATFTVALRSEPNGTVEVAVTHESGDPDITVQSGALLIFDSPNYSVPQTVTLAAAEDDDHIDGTALIAVNASGFQTAGVTAIEGDNEPNKNILFVDSGAQGADNGSNWVDAFTDLQEALATAAVFSQFNQILVAQGIYRPAEAGGARTVSFQLVDGVAVYGGFPPGGGSWNSRDPDAYETILSGDLNSDDGADFANNDENSYHVVNSTGTGDTTVLDGFTITAGNANGDYPYNSGGGIYNEGGETYGCVATVSNCRITGNSANYGGAMLNHYRGIVIIGMGGPGLTVTNCIFSGNAAGVSGGAIYNASSNPVLDNCVISKNSAVQDGGGVFNGGSSPLVSNCTLSDNSAGGYGGGITNIDCWRPMFINCTFSGNSAGLESGGLDCWLSNPRLNNCIFWGNSDIGGMDESAQLNIDLTTAINYCCVQGWTGAWGGTGNIDADPCFADPCNSDYHLKSQGWRWDTQRKVWTWDDVTSRCIDAGNPGSPLGDELLSVPGNPNNIWGQNLRINMGAFGGTSEASMPPYDWMLLSDITNDGISDFNDLDILSSLWLNAGELLYADFDRDGNVDFLDFALLAQDWLEQTTWH